MTQQCRDGRGSDFSDWLRDTEELDSVAHGFVATDIDYFWRNYRTGKFMILEEKTHFKKFKDIWQIRAYKILDAKLRNDKRYHGFHVIQFEDTAPYNGETRIDGEFVDYPTLVNFLRFECSEEMYTSYFAKRAARIATPT